MRVRSWSKIYRSCAANTWQMGSSTGTGLECGTLGIRILGRQLLAYASARTLASRPAAARTRADVVWLGFVGCVHQGRADSRSSSD